MKRVLNISIVFLCFLGIAPFVQAQKGNLQEKVICDAEPDQSYAIYLPEGYQEENAYPTLILFEPGARGAFPLPNFQKAADAFGWIVACSYNSQNGSWESTLVAWKAMKPDLVKKFSVDPERIYTGGFSGGARAACGIAHKNPGVQGVIACGAGIPTEEAYVPGDRPFPIATVVGMQDMNLLELYQLQNWFAQRNMPNNLITFEGTHQWPDAQSLHLAFAWLEVQYKKEHPGRKGHLMPSLAQQWFDLVEKPVKDNPVSRMRQYLYLQETVPEDLHPEGLKSSIKSLQEDPDYQSYKKELTQVLQGEQLKRTIYQSSFLVSPEKYEDSLTFAGWERMIGELQDKAKQNNRAQRDQALRLLNMIQAACIEVGGYALQDKNYKRLILLYKIYAIQYPEKAFGPYMIARGYAGLKSKKKCLKYLKVANSQGFKWLQGLEREEFAFLAENKKFLKIKAETQANANK